MQVTVIDLRELDAIGVAAADEFTSGLQKLLLFGCGRLALSLRALLLVDAEVHDAGHSLAILHLQVEDVLIEISGRGGHLALRSLAADPRPAVNRRIFVGWGCQQTFDLTSAFDRPHLRLKMLGHLGEISQHRHHSV